MKDHAIVFPHSWAILQNLHVFFNLKNYEYIFLFKTVENSFSLWPTRTRFGHVVRMCILYADFGDDFPDLEVMQVCYGMIGQQHYM